VDLTAGEPRFAVFLSVYIVIRNRLVMAIIGLVMIGAIVSNRAYRRLCWR
jgi:hypothetical protein